VYKVEPSEPVFSCNLFAHDRIRAVVPDKVVERGPQVPLVSKPASFACRAERLAWARSSPYRAIVGPSCEPKRVAPHSDAGKEVALGKSSKVSWANVLDASLIDFPRRDHPGFDEFPQPFGRKGVEF
jgi:hypothetical protein